MIISIRKKIPQALTDTDKEIFYYLNFKKNKNNNNDIIYNLFVILQQQMFAPSKAKKL